MEYDSSVVIDLVKHIPAVIVFWFLMVRPHMQKIEVFMQRVAVSSEESAETLKTIQENVRTLEHRITIVERRIDDTPLLGVKVERKES